MDVLQHIYSLMPMRDAARAACVSSRFLRFWRRYPNLAFNQESLAARRQPFLRSKGSGKYVFSKAKQVLAKHSGIGVKTLQLNLSTCCKEDISTSLLDGWLRTFVKPGIAKLVVLLPECYEHEYNFPCSLLSSDETGSSLMISLQYLSLTSCGFHPIEGRPRLLGCSNSLSRVCLRKVSVTERELGSFLSNCFALERLDLSNCDMVTSLKIPCVLQKFSVLQVKTCRLLRMIESEAPNFSTFSYEGWPLERFSLGNSLDTKKLDMRATHMGDMIQYAGNNLPSIAKKLEALFLATVHEKLKAPTMVDKFQHLKHLVICLGESGRFCSGYNFFSLACFLHACPALESFILRPMIFDNGKIAEGFAWYNKFVIVGKPEQDSSHPMQDIPAFHHCNLGNLRKVVITGFCSAKSLVQLTCHIVESASSSLQSLTLDTSPGYDRKRSSTDRCWPMRVEALQEAEKALTAVRRDVEPMIPAGIELKVLGPCNRCHAMDAKAMKEAESRIPRSFLQRQEDGSVVLVLVQPRP
ncbi:hypothetical protein ACP4OV_022094 [Aristida adscensionis]